MATIAVTTNISNKVISKETAIENAVADALAANPGYDVADVTVANKPDGAYNVVTLLVN
jgi:hypothetical protein